MKKTVFLISLITFITTSLWSQRFINGSLQISNLSYPGLNAEYEIVFSNKDFTKTSKKGKTKNKSRQFLGAANLGFYNHANSHFGLINTFVVKYQKLTSSQFYYSTGLGFGFNTNFLGETYKVNDNGEVKKIPISTRSYFAPHFQVLIGRQFKKSKLVDAIFLRQNVHYLLNYNYSAVPLINIELGLRFKLNTEKK